jgi:hypothetical protein
VYVPREKSDQSDEQPKQIVAPSEPATRPEIVPVEIPTVEPRSEPTSRVVPGLVITRGPARTTNSELIDQAIDALSDMYNPDDIRKVAYMIGQIRNGHDLSTTLQEVLRTYKRRTQIEPMSEIYASAEQTWPGHTSGILS